MAKIDAMVLYSAVRLVAVFFDRSNNKLAGTGSGFIITDTAENRYLVTNRHVLDHNFKKFGGWELESVKVDGQYQSAAMDILSTVPQQVTITDPAPRFLDSDKVDLAVLPLDAPLGHAQALVGEGTFNSLPASMLASAADFAFGRVAVGGTVLTPGYPGIGGEVAERPILVGGVISSDPRYPAALGIDTYPSQVLTHSFSWNGMSGSPVLCYVPKELTWGDLETGNYEELILAGVNAGHIKTSGETAGVLTRFIRADALAELLNVAGAQGIPMVRTPKSESDADKVGEDGPYR
ncbi:trypsin-like peptidase domain-containing protein [Actinacidiphila oryziradicis]|nr:trypsin-like peptidase domain-containing protein [Actinacidiphila oryziradicis]